MKRVSVVAGTFNEADNIEEFLARVHAVFDQLPQYELEIIIIDNASLDGTPDILRQMAASDPRLKVILNARNFGHVRSPHHGILQATGEAVLHLASDLQDPPELMPQFLAKWEEGYKAVVGVKSKSEESRLMSGLRAGYYGLLHHLAEFDIIKHFTGFGLYDRRIVEYLRALDDTYPYTRGLISEIGLPTAQIPFVKPARKRGLTKSNFYTLYDMAMLGLTNHSKLPLRLATMAGFFLAFVSLFVGLAYLVYKLLFWERFNIGIAPIVIGLFLFSSVQLFFIGILGEYIGAIHTQVLRRPLVVEKERINF